MLLFAVLFVVLFIIISFVTRPAATSLGFKSDAYASFLGKWGNVIPFISIVFAGITFVVALIVGAIIRLIGYGNTKTRTIALLVGLLPNLAMGIQLSYYEHWWSDVARLVIPIIGYPLFTTSWVMMVIVVIYGVVGVVRKR